MSKNIAEAATTTTDTKAPIAIPLPSADDIAAMMASPQMQAMMASQQQQLAAAVAAAVPQGTAPVAATVAPAAMTTPVSKEEEEADGMSTVKILGIAAAGIAAGALMMYLFTRNSSSVDGIIGAIDITNAGLNGVTGDVFA